MKTKTTQNSSKTPKLINASNQNKVPFSVVEAYKSTRIQLVSILNKIKGKVVAVSSPNASEGKSTTAINVAMTLAQLNKKVLLIDADTRRPTTHTKLKMENDLGCLDVILGAVEAASAVKEYNPYLDVLTSGSAANNPSELFSTNEFNVMLDALKENYDYIIIDTPPVNIVSDALVISQKCDGLILIVRTGVTTFESFKKALASTKKLNINILGVIMNGSAQDTGRYYKYNKYKYEYYK